MTALLISAIAFTIGLAYTWSRWGVQKSISITFYEHENALLWYVWFLCFALPILTLVDHFLLFLAIGSIAFVGAAPDFKSTKIQEAVHIGGAYAGIILAFAYLVVKGEYLTPAIMVIFTVYATLKLNNKTTWIEVAAFYLTLIGLAIIQCTL